MIKAIIKDVTLEPRAVKRAADRWLIRAISGQARYSRTAIRSSIRRRKKTADPGKPPTNRLGYLKKGILYAVDRTKVSAVVGAVKARTNVAEKLNKSHPYILPGVIKGIKNYNLKQLEGKL